MLRIKMWDCDQPIRQGINLPDSGTVTEHLCIGKPGEWQIEVVVDGSSRTQFNPAASLVRTTHEMNWY
jgi:hypothetical protein